jgi:hypothetical protein
VALALTAVAAEPARPDPALAGRWLYKGQFLTVESVLLPDGRYFAETRVGDAKVPQRGKYSVKDGKITFDVEGGNPVTYPYRLKDDKLEVTTTELGKMVYSRIATGREVVAEARKADAARAKEDDEWRKKLAVEKMLKQPTHVAVGEVPADKNVERIFEKPAVFTKPQLYLRQGLEEYVYRNNDPPGAFRTHFHWHFLPTGRVYVKAVTYTGSVLAPRQPGLLVNRYYVSGKTEVKKFGRYRIEKDESVTVEMDDDEKAALKLIDGRRNLTWGKTMYGNVHWELEALKRMEKKKP